MARSAILSTIAIQDIAWTSSVIKEIKVINAQLIGIAKAHSDALNTNAVKEAMETLVITINNASTDIIAYIGNAGMAMKVIHVKKIVNA